MIDFGQLIGPRRVIAIIRGQTLDSTVTLAVEAWTAGIHSVEVTVETAAGLGGLAALANLAGPGRHLGAGTVLSGPDAAAALAAGAEFLVSPGFVPDVAELARDAAVPYLPGVATATEVGSALQAGYTWLKAFPAASLGTGWVSSMLGPFPAARFIATGGVRADTAATFLDAGCAAVGIGIRTPAEIASLAFPEVTVGVTGLARAGGGEFAQMMRGPAGLEG